MSLNIQTAPKYLHAGARGMLDYINRHLDAKGLFSEDLNSLGEHLSISHAYAHKFQKMLIDGEFITIVTPSKRGRSGRYDKPVVLRPTGKPPDAQITICDSVNATKCDSVKSEICDAVDVVDKTASAPSHSFKELRHDSTESLRQTVTANTLHSAYSTESRAVGDIANSTSVGAKCDSVNCVACAMLGKVGTPVARRGPNGYCLKHNGQMFWLGEGE